MPDLRAESADALADPDTNTNDDVPVDVVLRLTAPLLRYLVRAIPEAVHMRDIHGRTPLDLAKACGHVVAIDVLRGAGAVDD